MPEIEIPYEPRAQQLEIHRALDAARFGVVVCHRRMGKTVLAINHLLRGALTCKRERPRYGYIAPTYTQGKATAFDYILHYSRVIPGAKPNQSELRVDFPNGGQIRIYGADNPDSLRGLYFDGVVLDEYGLHPPKTYSEVIAPTLVDRGGWCLFMGTPNGKNQFWDIAQQAMLEQQEKHAAWFFREFKASQTQLLDPKWLKQAQASMTTDEYAQEFECSFEAAVKGAIYAKELAKAREENRITQVPYDPALPVDTDWDLGIGDAMAIWFSQSTRSGEVRLIDYFESSGEGMQTYIALLKSKPYVYGTHWAPHDINVRELTSGRTRLEVAAGMGLKFEVVPRIQDTEAGELEEGIHMARMLMGRCWWDAGKCLAGLEALLGYHRDYNEKLRIFKATPVHDAASHGADAFRYLAVRHRTPEERKRGRMPEMPRDWGWA